MKKYTVVGLDEHDGESITEHIEARTPAGAMRKFARARANSNVAIVEIFEGELVSVSPCCLSVVCEDLV
jgi:hypothetical protein